MSDKISNIAHMTLQAYRMYTLSLGYDRISLVMKKYVVPIAFSCVLIKLESYEEKHRHSFTVVSFPSFND